MRRLLKLLVLPAEDRVLLLCAAWWVGAVRFGLWLVPFGTLRRWLIRMTRAKTESLTFNPSAIKRVVWAVTAVSRYVPAATCLTQALATQVMLGRRGQLTNLRIGVAKSVRGQLKAHAWLELDGQIVIGEQKDLTRYTPLSSLKEERP